MPRSSILIAATRDGQERLERALADCEIALAATPDEVASQLAGRRFDVVILGTHFAESSLFEVLGRLPRERCGRIVCVQAVPFSHGLGRSTFAAFRSACLEIGADAVLDLTEFSDIEDDARVRAALLG